MTLASAAQFIGVCALIASVVFTGLQIRRQTRTIRAGAHQAVSQSFVTMWKQFVDDADLLDLMLRGCDDFEALARHEKARFRFNQMAGMRNYENAWFQHRVGILHEEDWQAVVGDLEGMLSTPGAQKSWSMIRNCSGASFRALVDAKIIEINAARAPDA